MVERSDGLDWEEKLGRAQAWYIALVTQSVVEEELLVLTYSLFLHIFYDLFIIHFTFSVLFIIPYCLNLSSGA